MQLMAHKKVEMLEPTQADFPGLKHCFHFSETTVVDNDGIANVSDLIGDVVLSLGALALVSYTSDGGVKFGSAGIDMPLGSGNWVQPATKTAVVMGVFATDSTGTLIIGSSLATNNSDAIRNNRASSIVFDQSESASVSPTAPALTTNAAAVATRITPADTVNSMETDGATLTVNTEASAATILMLDGIGDVIGMTAGQPYWGCLIWHFDNPPSDKVLGEAMLLIRDSLLNDGKMLIPSLLKDYS